MIHRKQLLMLALSLVGACHRGQATWDPSAPLAPVIQFVDPIRPRSMLVLALDAHSGAPLMTVRAMITAAALAPGPDSLGRMRFSNLPLGPQRLRVIAIGYTAWQGLIAVSDSTGLAVIVQLRRSMTPPIPVVTGTEPPARR
jgi:hypothetical protein